MQSSATHILPLAKIRHSRMLPIPGTVYVRAGQDVAATDLVAEVSKNPEHLLLDVASGLGISVEKTTSYIKREIGDTVPQDGIIAERTGVGRVVRAPKAGTIVAISGGKVLLQTKRDFHQVFAGMKGTVREVKANFGAVIETSGAWVQGVWGNDKIATGILTVLAQFTDHVLEVNETIPVQKDSVVLGGYCEDLAVLEAGEENQWSGLILGSMATKLVPAALKMPYPIIVLEGFGQIPLNNTAHKLLSTSAQREISINAMPKNPFLGERPEITIPLDSSGTPPNPLEMQTLEPGVQVRVLRSPYTGKIGIINQLLPGMTRFPSGLQASGAEIALGNDEKVVVPLANIEVLG